MSPSTVEEKLVSLSRPPLRPSLRCNLFGHKDSELTIISEDDFKRESYQECSRCGEREHFSMYTLSFSVDIQPDKKEGS